MRHVIPQSSLRRRINRLRAGVGQWRGPSRDGVVAVVPAWPTSANGPWVGEAIRRPSSPTGARSCIAARSEEIVTAITPDRRDRVATEVPAAFTRTGMRRRWRGPNSTPLVAGSRLYTLGVTGILTAWDVADGTIAWRQDYSSSIDTSKLFCGTAMSPLLEGGSLIVQIGSDVHGSACWHWIRPPAGDGPGRGRDPVTPRRSR